MTTSFGLTAPRHALGFTLPRDQARYDASDSRNEASPNKTAQATLTTVELYLLLSGRNRFLHTTLRPATRVPDFHVRQMKTPFKFLQLGLCLILAVDTASASTISLSNISISDTSLTFTIAGHLSGPAPDANRNYIFITTTVRW